MTVLVVLTVIVIAALIAGLAVYLYWAGTLLDRIGAKLEGAAEIVDGIVADAGLIMPGVDHINRTGGVVAGALPLLYGMAEGIVTGVTPREPLPEVPEPARPASGTRRSRLLAAVGFVERLHHPRRVVPATCSESGAGSAEGGRKSGPSRNSRPSSRSTPWPPMSRRTRSSPVT
jgi:hypothetical protein